MRRVCVLFVAASLVLALRMSAEPVQGLVLEDHTGRPLVFAGVRIYKADGTQALAAPLLTDLNGRFTTPDLPPGDYEIEGYHQDYLSTRMRFQAPAEPLTLRLPKLGTIWGRVLDLEGRPNAGARVAVMYKPAQGLVLQPYGPPLTVNRDGQFRASGLPPGEYAVAVLGAAPAPTAASPNLYYYPRNERPQFFAFAGGEQYSGVDFRVPAIPRFRFSGRLALPADGPRAVIVLYWPEQPLLPVASARTSSDGSWALDQVPFGEYLLLAIRPTFGFGSQGGMLSPDDVVASARVRLDRDLDGFELSLPSPRTLVLTIASAAPQPPAGCPATAPVTLVPQQPPGSQEPISVSVPLNQPLELSRVLPGRYRTTAALGERCFLTSPALVDVSDALQQSSLALEIAPGSSLAGRVKSETGAAGRFLVVLLPAPQSPPAPARVTQLDASGRFLFENLPPGHYRIALRAAESLPRSRWFPPLTQMLEVRIPPGSAVETELEPPPLSYR